ncbi:MAG: hypothetical protein LBO73_04315 [Holosporaceae bacterium]|jgi:hypothetical protein|nr:hypothetical protein [Holosporaceae bacterium]
MNEITFFKLIAVFWGGWLANSAVSRLVTRKKPDRTGNEVSDVSEDFSPSREVGFQMLNKIGCFLESNDNKADRTYAPTPLQDSGPQDTA